MKVEFKKAQASDIDFLIDLREQTMLHPMKDAGLILSPEEHCARAKSYFENTNIVYYLNIKIGMFKKVEKNASIDIVQLQILPAYQKKGIGSSILEHICQESRSLNKSVKLKVLKGSPAIALYERIGFQVYASDDYEFDMHYGF